MKEVASRAGITATIPRTLWFGSDLSGLVGQDFGSDWVVKPNNSSGQVYFGSGAIDSAEACEIVRAIGKVASLHRRSGEWAYSQAREGFLAEPLIGCPPLPDYKVFVFHGYAVCVDVHLGRFSDKSRVTFSRKWERLRGVYGDSGEQLVERPEMLDELLGDAERISAGFDFMRVDFYVSEGRHYFGETTPYPGSGKIPIDRDFDRFLGLLWRSGSEEAVRALYPQISSFLDSEAPGELHPARVV